MEIAKLVASHNTKIKSLKHGIITWQRAERRRNYENANIYQKRAMNESLF